MDMVDGDENLFSVSDAKLHGGMCKILSDVYTRIMNIFPAIEAARPRSRTGIQALCSLHIALEKASNTLQHCSECSKLYLAITGDSVLSKFERAKGSLVESLRRVEDIVPQSIGCQILDIATELEGTVFSLEPSEKQVGDDIIALFQQGKRFDDSHIDCDELESFHQAASKLGINSSRAALVERRALRKLIERTRMEEDKRKESIVAYLLHLMRKYSKLFRSDLTDDYDSQSSSPCSPTVQGSYEYGSDAGSNCRSFDRQLSKLNSFNLKPSLSFRPSDRKAGHIPPIPPEELRCPISLQLMYDPVIISSGQTYERVCIDKWFSDGHSTCPKTQKQLCHLCLTPNYCVKGLIASWCEQHGVQVPDSPPESLDLNYWRLALSDTESAQSRSTHNHNSCKLEVVPLQDSESVEKEWLDNEAAPSTIEQDGEILDNEFGTCQKFLNVLNGEDNLRKKCIVVEQIRCLLKDDEDARIYMGAQGFVEALVQFLKSSVYERNELAQEVGAMALFNIAVNNNRNKELMLSAGVVPLLEEMIGEAEESHALIAALSLNVSCLEKGKAIVGSSSKLIPFLMDVLQLQGRAEAQSKLDALHTVFNLSTYPCNIPKLVESGIISGLHSHLKEPRDPLWTEKAIAVLVNLGGSSAGKEGIIGNEGLMSELASILEVGEAMEQEQAAACLLMLCTGNEECTEMVLQEGVIPPLVCLSVNGTPRGRDKSHKLLMLFRQHRHQPPEQPRPKPMPLQPEIEPKPMPLQPEIEPQPQSLTKSASTRVLGRTFSLFRKNRNYLSRK